MKEILIAANWKMNKGPKDTAEFFQQYLDTVTEDEQGCFAFFPSAICLAETAIGLSGTEISWGAQNCYFEDSGAFTGETSPQILSEMGAQMTLVGHSERRHIFNETDEVLNKKVLALQKWDITPMICVGETLEQRDAEETDQVISSQLVSSLSGADLEKEFIVAYEPVWAIGTGRVATPEIAEAAHKTLRSELVKLVGADRAQKVRILYGGSAKAENANDLFSQENIDGFLVGGASLEVDSFYAILQAVK
ncbi:MAG: triose-phosphate isomerase [Bdellovibrionaceae bacterium]|nr:triose-phosphate isomerase [Pseudobdellovibrionaceae bacterium]